MVGLFVFLMMILLFGIRIGMNIWLIVLSMISIRIHSQRMVILMDINVYSFSELRSLRKASGLSQSELASLVHVSQNVISAYECFEYAPAGLVLAGLQSVFNCIFIFNNEQYEAWKLHNDNYTVGGTKDG